MTLNKSQWLRAHQEIALREALKDAPPAKGTGGWRRVERFKDELELRKLEKGDYE